MRCSIRGSALAPDDEALPPARPFRDTLWRLLRHRLFLTGLVLSSIVLLAAVAAHWAAGVDPARIAMRARFRPPSPTLGVPQRLRVRRQGKSNLRASWRRVGGATRYELAVTLSSGRQRFVTTRKRTAVVKGIARSQAGRVTVRARGQEFTRMVVVPKGEPANFLTEAELRAKFAGLTDAVLGAEQAARLADAVLAIDRTEDVAELMRLSVPPPPMRLAGE